MSQSLPADLLVQGVQVASVAFDGTVLREEAIGTDVVGASLAKDSLMLPYCSIKPLLGATLVDLDLEGVFSLDRPVGAYLPWLHGTLAALSAAELLTQRGRLAPVEPWIWIVATTERRRALLCDYPVQPADRDLRFEDMVNWELVSLAVEAATGASLSSHASRRFPDRDLVFRIDPGDWVDLLPRLATDGFRTTRGLQPNLALVEPSIATDDLPYAFTRATAGGIARALAEVGAITRSGGRRAAAYTDRLIRVPHGLVYDATHMQTMGYSLGSITTMDALGHRVKTGGHFGHAAWGGSAMSRCDFETGCSVSMIFSTVLLDADADVSDRMNRMLEFAGANETDG